MGSMALPDTPNGSISRADQVGRMLFMASKGDAEGIQEMLDAGVDPNLADYDGRTALHLAASDGRVNVVKLLLERKADPNPIDRHGNTVSCEAFTRQLRMLSSALRVVSCGCGKADSLLF